MKAPVSILPIVEFILIACVAFNSLINCSSRGVPPSGQSGGRANSAANRPEEKQIVKFTPAAIAKLREFQAAGGGGFVRVLVYRDNQKRFAYDIRLEDQNGASSDFVSVQDGIRILVSRESSAYLTGAEIDWRRQPDGSEGFHFENPNAL
jgi:Fe-S cluster assembly iron-binding protein IscA